MSAAMTWAIRDGLGMLGGLLFSYIASPHFDAHVKEFRLLADVLNDIALTIDMALPSMMTFTWSSSASLNPTMTLYLHSLPLPSTYLVLTSISTLCKVACGISAGATKGNITDHFAICGNRADVNAKESTQETLVSLMGMILGVLLARWLSALEDGEGGACINFVDGIHDRESGNFDATCVNEDASIHSTTVDIRIISWTIFTALTIFHVWANYVGVQQLRLRTLNRERARVALLGLFEHCGKLVSKTIDDDYSKFEVSLDEDNLRGCIQKLHSPTNISESLWTSIRGLLCTGNIHLGIRVQDFFRSNANEKSSHGLGKRNLTRKEWNFLFDEFQHENYMIIIDVSRNDINVMMRIGANCRDELKAFVHAFIIQWIIDNSSTNRFSCGLIQKMLYRTHSIVQKFIPPEESNSVKNIDLYQSLADIGWDLSRLYLGFSQWRCSWE
ncbi:hypothetical protein ACHAXS_003271 [Conticribra weissflogii]